MTTSPNDFPTFEHLARDVFDSRTDTDSIPSTALAFEIGWIMNRGARTHQTALAVLNSPDAQHILREAWAEECPPLPVLEAAVVGPESDGEAATLADATRELVKLHTSTCQKCARLVADLDAMVAASEPTNWAWEEHLTGLALESAAWRETLSSSPVRASHTSTTPFTRDLSPETWTRLTGEEAAEYQLPRIEISYSPTDEGTLSFVVPLTAFVEEGGAVIVSVAMEDGRLLHAPMTWSASFAPAGTLHASFIGVGPVPIIDDIKIRRGQSS